MNAEMEEAKQGFKQECEELLQDMEDGLLRLESEPEDADCLGAVFRAAHTIKGSAGVFGLDDIVHFTHVVEGLLDNMRDGSIGVTEDAIALLLKASDHMEIIVPHVIENDCLQDEALRLHGDDLIAEFNRFQNIGSVDQSSVATLSNNGEDNPVSVEDSRVVSAENWHVSLRFGRDVLRNGMDPLSFLRYLGTLGEIVNVTTLFDELPSADQMDPEECYLGFEIAFSGDVEKQAIEQTFEFVRDDCIIHIIPPRSSISRYVEFIKSLPDDDLKIGEILVEGGILTRRELDEALQKQNNAADKLGDVLVKEGLVDREVVEAAVGKQSNTRKKISAEKHTVRIEAGKLDHLINLVGELVIASARSFLLAQKNGDVELVESISDTTRLVEEIRDNTLKARMVQIGDTFNRFQRVVRDISKSLNKAIKLTIHGGDTELDKTVIEKIGDPLMHLVRNSIDHGIEDAETRVKNGKPSEGTLALNAFHDSGSIVIEITDDGAGLNREKILAKAVANGLVADNQSLTDNEIDRLVFEPGFSTADQVTNLSGRGVGMDVVKRNIEALRGSVNVFSEPGVGTTFSIRLPLTLAIIDGFLLGVGDATYVVPLDMVVECVELTAQECEDTRNNNYINLRGEVLPFIRLQQLFGERKVSQRRENIVVVQYAGQKAGLVVDALLGEFQTVIKPLGKVFQMLKGVSGATILGSGEVAVILDVPALVGQVEHFNFVSPKTHTEHRIVH